MFGEITLGADPEVFAKKNGEIISAENMTTGTKEYPFLISGEGHAIQKDNIMLEFNIPASETEEDFVNNINTCKEYIETLLALNDCELEIKASSLVDKKYLQTEQAMMFGCEPDLNVYLGTPNPSINATSNLRTCGGHIHVGSSESDYLSMETKEKLVKAMDITLGLESVLLDDDGRRRTMYGNAGSFRDKPYGIEYRTLSNFWIKDDKSIKWAYNKTLEAISLVESGLIDELIKKYSKKVRKAIDKNSKKDAIALLNKINSLIIIE